MGKIAQAATTRVLLAGVSTRAAAESAVRAGFDVIAVDGFNDLDADPSVQRVPIEGRFTAWKAARASRGVECDAVAYLASFENHPGAVDQLAARRALWGNPPAVLRRVRDPTCLVRELKRRGFVAPAVYTANEVSELRERQRREPGATQAPAPRWLVKPTASGGGYGIVPWQYATSLSNRVYLQEFIEGTPGSVVFVAAHGRSVPIGVSRQLVGDHNFGASGFHYCGSVLSSPAELSDGCDAVLFDAARALAQAVAEAFDLVGVNGIDFVANDGVPYVVEVNPRWSSSMELAERAYGISLFGLHAEACTSDGLPELDFCRVRPGANSIGKAVVFAKRDVVVGNTRPWLLDPSVRDVPPPKQRIGAGRPLCTVFATGPNAAACYVSLVHRAEQIYAELDGWPQEPG